MYVLTLMNSISVAVWIVQCTCIKYAAVPVPCTYVDKLLVNTYD